MNRSNYSSNAHITCNFAAINDYCHE